MEIQRLDSELASLLAATNQENEDFDTKVSKIKKRQTKVIKSFDTLKTKLDKYNNMASDIHATPLRKMNNRNGVPTPD